MLDRAPQGRSPARSPVFAPTGFTLIELLVVLVLIGIVVSFGYLSVGSRSQADQLEREAQRLIYVAELARQETILQGNMLGFRMREGCYAFMSPEADRWKLLADPLLGRHETHESIRLELSIEGVDASRTKARDEMAPQLLFLPSGEVTPFEVRMRIEGLDVAYRITANLLGEFELTRETLQ